MRHRNQSEETEGSMAGIVEGKVAIVTGGGGAIGSAIARLLG